MEKKVAEWFQQHLTPVMFTAGLTALLYAVVTSWQNEQRLLNQDDQLAQIGSDVSQVKKSLISMLLEVSPNKSEIIKGLISDKRTFEGIERFKAGNYDAAFGLWAGSATQGSEEAVYTIGVAKDALRDRAADMSLPLDERVKAQAALLKASRLNFPSAADNLGPQASPVDQPE